MKLQKLSLRRRRVLRSKFYVWPHERRTFSQYSPPLASGWFNMLLVFSWHLWGSASNLQGRMASNLFQDVSHLKILYIYEVQSLVWSKHDDLLVDVVFFLMQISKTVLKPFWSFFRSVFNTCKMPVIYRNRMDDVKGEAQWDLQKEIHEDVSVCVRACVCLCVRVRFWACVCVRWRDIVIELWLKWQVNPAPFSCRLASPRPLSQRGRGKRVSEGERVRERTRKRGSVCTCTGEEERRKGKLGVQETDFFVFYFCLINLLFLVSQRGKTQSECQRTRLPASACVCFLFLRRGGTRR